MSEIRHDQRRVEIVLVDDDEGHCLLTRRHLQRAGISNPITTFHDGASALDYIRGKPGELLVLLDINMPGIDGIEVLRQLKGDAATRRVPVIMLTTTDDARDVRRCYEAGCSFYIVKPVEAVSFTEVIRRMGLFLEVVKLPDGGA